ncbi:hypothetical protein QE152_g23168 [Popillia japonica]|uniref:Uncharacterized protein n=1 Tax=Popillia japonica TaxID=7064 RepID=A0AAW1KHZ2_POPJA
MQQSQSLIFDYLFITSIPGASYRKRCRGGAESIRELEEKKGRKRRSRIDKRAGGKKRKEEGQTTIAHPDTENLITRAQKKENGDGCI